MGVTFIAPQGTYTAPAKLVTKEITENGTYDATDDSANGYSSVTVNVEGGGGSSDFSTATMTISNMDGGSIDVYAPIVENNMSKTTQSLSEGEYTVILYKGKARLLIDIDPEYYTISGDITLDNDAYIVEGDFSISYNA